MDAIHDANLQKLWTVGAETLVSTRQQLEKLRGIFLEPGASHLAFELGAAEAEGPEPESDIVPTRGDRLDPGRGDLGVTLHGARELREGREREVIGEPPERARDKKREHDHNHGRTHAAAHGG
jgi:hypothetical protein